MDEERSYHMTPEEFRRRGREVVDWIADYMECVEELPVGSRVSAGEITELLLEDGVQISVSTIGRVLAEEGFPKLPRRTRLKIGRTVKGAEVPKRSEAVTLNHFDGQRFESAAAGAFLFAPFLARFDIAKVVAAADMVIPRSRSSTRKSITARPSWTSPIL